MCLVFLYADGTNEEDTHLIFFGYFAAFTSQFFLRLFSSIVFNSLFLLTMAEKHTHGIALRVHYKERFHTS